MGALLLDRRVLPKRGALTLSAGVITDATRLAGVEGDGEAPPDGSVYVGPAATNLGDTVGDMSFESLAVGSNMAADGWTNSTGGTAVISDEVVKFGTKSGKITTGGASLYQRLELPFTSTPGTYTWPVWLYAPSPLTKVRLAFGGPTDGAVLSNELAVADEWVQFSVTKTITVIETVKATIYVSYGVNTSGAVLYISGPMPVLSPIALPFTPTSRPAGRITLPVSGIFTATQGWFVARIKTGFAAAGPGYVPRLMSYGDAVDNGLWLAYDGAGWTVVSDATGGAGSVSAASADGGLVIGDSRTIYGGWKSDRVNVTKGTTAWPAGTARSEVPTVASAVIDIGSLSAWLTGREAACAFEWVVMGDGLYTAVDPSIAGNWGDNDPQPHMLPRAAQPTALLVANGDGTLYRYAA